MKQITFIRHAKSNHIMGLRDHDRPLNEQGLSDAPEMAARLKSEGFSPDVFFTSTALRALTTAELIRSGIHSDIPLMEKPILYHAFINDYTQFIHEINDDYHHMAIIGHNPTISMMVNLLAKDHVIDSMPTCCVITLAFENADSWKLISPHTAIVQRYLHPGQ